MIACVWFPNWPIQCLRRGQPELKGTLAIHVGGKIIAATEPSLVGLTVAEAAGRGVEIGRVVERDPQAERAQLESLACWCDQFSPRVGIEDDCLLLDMTGVSFDSKQLAKAIGQQGFVARITVARTVGLAWALACYAEPLPVAALRLASDTLQLLEALGIRAVAELQKLPRDQLASRFPDVVQRLDQLTGAVAEPIVPYRPPAVIGVERDLEYPVGQREMIAALCSEAIAKIAGELSSRQQGAVRLELALDGAKFLIGLFQPSDSPRYLRELVDLQLEQVRLAGPVTKIGLRVLAAAPLRARQRELFDDGHDRQRQLGLFVDRLGCRSPALRAILVADAEPERAFRYEAFTSRKRAAIQPAPVRRPLWVEPRPIPIDVISGGGPPRQFTWRGERYRVIRAWGPERILTGWWRGSYLPRDYYQVETAAGCYWLFRARKRWFLHGVF